MSVSIEDLFVSDLGQPTFKRIAVDEDGNEYEIKLWQPVQVENGGWVCPCTATNMSLPKISVMPGDDAIDSLLRALAFLRGVFDAKPQKIKWNGLANAGVAEIKFNDIKRETPSAS